MAGFFVFVIVVAAGVTWYFNTSPIILYGVVGIAIAINVVAYWNSDRMVIKMTSARPATREEYFDYWNAVENICISIGAQMPKLYVIDDPAPNAFATGRDPKHSAIVVTKGLLSLLDKNELEGVVAHELAHIQNRDTLLMTVTVILIGIVTIILDIALRFSIFGGSHRDGGNQGQAVIAIIVLVVVSILTPILLTALKMAISRKREFLADATGALYTRYPEGLASALRKISGHKEPMKTASTATAHLFISDPFAIDDEKGKKRKKGMFQSFHHFFDTHPPIEKRIEALLASEKGASEGLGV